MSACSGVISSERALVFWGYNDALTHSRSAITQYLDDMSVPIAVSEDIFGTPSTALKIMGDDDDNLVYDPAYSEFLISRCGRETVYPLWRRSFELRGKSSLSADEWRELQELERVRAEFLDCKNQTGLFVGYESQINYIRTVLTDRSTSRAKPWELNWR